MRIKQGYEATRLEPYSGALLRGTGDTMESARKDLKQKLQAQREAMKAGTYLQGTGEYLRSPGWMIMQDPKGRVFKKMNHARLTEVKARPDIAAWRKDERRKEEEAKRNSGDDSGTAK